MSEPSERAWEFYIDRGGTFTDVVARTPDGRVLSAKHLSDNPQRYADAALFAMQRLVHEHEGRTLADARIGAIKMGTTVATNALLERRGDATLFAVTAGFADALRVGYQNRPDIFALDIRRPLPLYERVVEVRERVDARGGVVVPLDTAALERDLRAAYSAGVRSVAIALLHGYAHAAHERACARLAREIGFTNVSASHEVGALVKLIARAETTVADAYLTPVLQRYVDALRGGLHGAQRDCLMFMQSSGGLTRATHFRGHNAILSGPAGGVVAMAHTARAAGLHRVIGFDMGGTSTDVTLYDGAFERDVDNEIAGVRLQTPMMRIHTVAAGGGSRLVFRDGRLQVGPESAGALPGPACYRNGGPLAVTDINVLHGKLQSDFFPNLFGPDGNQCLDAGASAAAFAELAREVGEATGEPVRPEALADGFARIAVDKMALAIRSACLSRGIDVDAFCLSAFGGAAGQHACQVAAALGIGTVLVNANAGVLSALGMGLADHTAIRVATVRQTLDDRLCGGLGPRFEALERAAREALETDGPVTLERRCRLRYRRADTALEVEYAAADSMRAAFEAEHERRFGLRGEGHEIVLESLLVEARRKAAPLALPRPHAVDGPPREAATRPVWLDGSWVDTPFYTRAALAPGHSLRGPAVVVDAHGTTVLEPGWHLRVLDDGQLLLENEPAKARAARDDARSDPVRLELFNNLFTHIAEQMGTVLQRTARSVNIKERLDFSCALFDRDGHLIANAPHMPVHLGSMGESVRAVMRAFAEPGDGDSYVLNDPFAGGTHLPDITVVTPYFGGGTTPIFYLAARGHHADVGGVAPGSMPAFSTRIDEEGVLLRAQPLVAGGRFLEEQLRAALSAARYPARDPDQNVADLLAQLAANRCGAGLLDTMLAEHGRATALAYTRHVQDNAAAAVERALDKLSSGRFELELDGGQRIAVAIEVGRGQVTVDFTGTSAQAADNFNAPAAVCRAAVLYAFRCLVDRPIPMNAGCLRPVRLIVPEGSLLSPRPPAAVAAGNVETSMCITDALFGALGVLAASQGTMNNVTFGDERVQYYETLCGGAGAGRGFDGCAAVHTHMTNSRLTDPEVIEARFPVRIERFAIRRGSGGRGRWCGGDGLVREYRFERDLEVAVLSNRRRTSPFGLAGGDSGARGVNTLLRADGRREDLGPTASVRVAAGDRLRIETPGGGGFGPAAQTKSP